MRKFTKELFRRLIVGVGRCLSGREASQVLVSSLHPNASYPSVFVQRNTFVSRRGCNVLTSICRILSRSDLTQIFSSIVQCIVVFVIRVFSAFTAKNLAVHLNRFFDWLVSSPAGIEAASIFIVSRNPVPLGQSFKVSKVNDGDLVSSERNQAVRFGKRLSYFWPWHLSVSIGAAFRMFHRSSLQGLLKFSRYSITLFLLLVCTTVSFSQNPSVIQPNCVVGFTFIATGRSTTYQNITPQGVPTKACTSWTMVYSNTGFSALSIEIDSAPDAGATPGVSPGSWTVWPSAQVAAGQVLPSTVTTSAGVTVFGFFPWVSVNLNSATGTGTVSGFLYGWQTQGSQESNTGATQVQGVTAVGSAPSTGNPIQIAWGSPTKPFVCTVTMSTNTTTQCQAAAAAGLRNYISSWLIQTNTAGTATALNLSYGTGTNCATGLTVLSAAFANTATNTATPANLSPLTPWQPAAANAVCVTQAGTTPGTSIVELHGFIAP